MRTSLLLLSLAANTFAAGPVLFGVRAGAPLTDSSSPAGAVLGGLGTSAGQRFEVGPTVGVRLPLGFSLEGDALYNRQALSFGQFGGINALGTQSNSWEFPVMLKFTAGRGVIAPVVGAGVTVRHINNFSAVPSYLFSGSTSPNTVGFVAGGGVRFKVGPVSVTPELRYTRWSGDNFSQSLLNFLPLSRNEASFLVGITF